MSNEEKKPGVWVQIVVPVAIALLVGGSSPWWCRGNSTDSNGNVTPANHMSGSETPAASPTGKNTPKSIIITGKQATGTFSNSDGEFKIQALGSNQLRVEFVSYDNFYPGMAHIEGDTAVFQPDEFEGCKITIKFLPNGILRVTQGNDDACSVAAGIDARGTYNKSSGQTPIFN